MLLIQSDARKIPLMDEVADAVVTDPPYGLSFMGKEWDHGVPGVGFWQEVKRVAKPGAYLLAFGGTRTHHRLMCAIEDAGWEIRDCLMWIYGSGFPKSLDISKAIDKAAGVTLAAKQWDGFGTALKPAYEPIILAMKPIEGTFAENVLKWGCGGLNIGESRIPGTYSPTEKAPGKGRRAFGLINDDGWKPTKESFPAHSKGRWPANLILDEESAKMMDDQNGGASRFFYCAKASRSERGKDNNHPTVKPFKLMQYLIRLVTPPNGIVLDPFCGSGTTIRATESLNFRGIGCDLAYQKIAKVRVSNIQKELLA